MFGLLKKVAPLFFVVAVAMTNSAFSIGGLPQSGGEIPWPLSIQHVVTVENSQGLWRLHGKEGDRLFNVEITSDSQSNFDWIRVAELNPNTYAVMSWGEGFFTPGKTSANPESSYSKIVLGKGVGGNDKHGRYITMGSNGFHVGESYLLRMVEVDSAIGKVLGLTIISFNNSKMENLLGTREMNEPMDCSEDIKTEKLKCFFNL